MSIALAAALVMAVACQSAAPPDRSRAEELARSGRTADALLLFQCIVEQDPGDVDAQMWLGVLELRLGHTDAAEGAFRAVLHDHPSHVGALIGLGVAQTRRGEWSEALRVLQSVEREAGENADLFAAFGRAYRRAGDDRRALEYLTRAQALAPDDPDLSTDLEAVALAYGHSVAVDGLVERRTDGPREGTGSVVFTVRANPRFHLLASVRLDDRSGSSEAIFGGGFRWRAARTTRVIARAMGGSGNSALPNMDLSADVIQQAGVLEVGGGARALDFSETNVLALSPFVSIDRGRLRVDTRYTYSRSSFAASGDTSGDHSLLVRPTWRAWRRVSLLATYAYGIESFEDLTVDRLGAVGATTGSAGLRMSLKSSTAVNAAWEHQWRSDGTGIDRVLIGLVQVFR